jgi:hypothetical protein
MGGADQTEFPKVVFPVLGESSAKTKESEQAFVGLPRNACLAALDEGTSIMSYDSEAETREHIAEVAARLDAVCAELRRRGERHDASKLGPQEKPFFDAAGPSLRAHVYQSEDYIATLKTLEPALNHHYANNSHHPQHYAEGIAGMDLIDLVEMYCDWAAATLRSKDGDLARSIELNIERFVIEEPLASLLRNTLKRFGGFTGPQGAAE